MKRVTVSTEDTLRLEPSTEVRLIKIISFQKISGKETVTLEMERGR